MSVGKRVISPTDAKIQGTLELTEKLSVGISQGLTAGDTQTQAGATNGGMGGIIVVATTATASDGVRLPLPDEAGQTVTVINAGAANLKIWPSADGTMNGGSADAADATLLATTKARTYYSTSALNWQKVVFE